MEIRNLITFVKVAEAGSLTGAARSLGYAQSSVTAQMKQLEQELGCPLYERVGKKIRITAAGQAFLNYAVQIVRMSEEALEAGKAGALKTGGSLRVGIMDILAGTKMAEMVSSYMDQFPEVELQVRVEYEKDTLLELLRHNEIDLAIILSDLVSDADLIHAGGDSSETMHFYVAREHPLAEGSDERAVWKAISGYPLICQDERVPWERGLTGQPGAELCRKVRVRSRDLAVEMAGPQAVLYMPEAAVWKQVQNGDLLRLADPFPPMTVWRQTLYHRNKWLTGAMEGWITMEKDTKDRELRDDSVKQDEG
ncbi:MAG: LysR family transcriptional regulator [Clostridiales bacterium]|nr:LysR family transcriptional regulator [Clostridiales bacterium]